MGQASPAAPKGTSPASSQASSHCRTRVVREPPDPRRGRVRADPHPRERLDHRPDVGGVVAVGPVHRVLGDEPRHPAAPGELPGTDDAEEGHVGQCPPPPASTARSSVWTTRTPSASRAAVATGEVQRAVDGLPRPGGLGGWFGRARFERLQVDLSAPGEVVD